MVRKRGPLDRIDKMMSKKRSSSALSETFVTPLAKRDRNVLNERMLSLYKVEISTNDESPLQKNKEEISCDKQPTKVVTVENSKPSNKGPKSTEKKKSSVCAVKQSTLTLDDFRGQDEDVNELLDSFLHYVDPELHSDVGDFFCEKILLHGPSGCGKTLLARAFAGEHNLPYIEVVASDLVCGISGESESKIQDMFEEAIKCAPCILFIDEIDVVTPKREATERGMEKRMVTQLLKCLDELSEKDMSGSVIVIGATNSPNSMDTSLRRRFEIELAIGILDEIARLKILQVLCKKCKLAPVFDMQWLAHHTPGFTGSDLKSLVKKACKVAKIRLYRKAIIAAYADAKENGSVADWPPVPNFELNPDSEIPLNLKRFCFKSKVKTTEAERRNAYITEQDFTVALKKCTPTTKREGFAAVPKVTWDDIGALGHIKEELQATILWPVKYAKQFGRSLKSSTTGILLYGPKGCGKTLLAKAIANECSINFLSVKGPELLSMYFGESERAIRQCFQKARNCAPCIIFFDEIDSLCPKRSGSDTNAAADRVVNQILTEMDGAEECKPVFVMATTNRLDKIDSAILRPGRLEELLFVGLPSEKGRLDILERLTKDQTSVKIVDDVDFESIAKECENFSGADLKRLVKKAISYAIRDSMRLNLPLEEVTELEKNHFDQALKVVKPSVTDKEREYYRHLVDKFQ